MTDQFQQPEPCLGGLGTHDRNGRCYSPVACSVFGFCRERAIKNKGEPTAVQREQWKAEAVRNATVEQQQYLERLDQR